MIYISCGDIVTVDGHLLCKVLAVYELLGGKKMYEVTPIDKRSHKRIVPEASVKLARLNV